MQCLKLLSLPGALSPGVKQPGREGDHSPPSIAKFKHAWRYTPPQYIFMAWYLVKHRGNFTFSFYLLFYMGLTLGLSLLEKNQD
jgi:hypothetical protein